MLKRRFTNEEKYGLTELEIRAGEKYLRKNKTRGAIAPSEGAKLYELFLLGYSFQRIHEEFPQYPTEQIIMTCALQGWAHDRDKLASTLFSRVQAKVIKSVVEQVDFLTQMLSVANAEHYNDMYKYIMDPINNPKPEMRIESIKEYKEVVETLNKIVVGVAPDQNAKKSPLFQSLAAKNHNEGNLESDKKEELGKDVTPAKLIEMAIKEESDNE